MEDKEKKEFYVYIYLDPRKPGEYIYDEYKFEYEPFYVGKGKGNRLYSHLFQKDKYNSHKTNKINSIYKVGLEPIVLKVNDNLKESVAFKIEKFLIEKIGRSPNGVLTNKTIGGSGGKFDNSQSDEFRIKMREVNKKWCEENYEKEKLRRENVSKTIRKQIKELGHGLFKGYKHSELSKSKISENNKIKQKGALNSQFGTCWIHNLEQKINKKINKTDSFIWLNNGWILGRKIINK